MRLIIADDLALAVRCGADGVHVPQARAHLIASAKRLKPQWLVTASAHDKAAVDRAGRLGADAVLVSPVFATHTHSGSTSLGVVRLAALVAGRSVPIVALGGISAISAGRLVSTGVAGIALISGWL